jgi:hypothetical protein
LTRYDSELDSVCHPVWKSLFADFILPLPDAISIPYVIVFRDTVDCSPRSPCLNLITPASDTVGSIHFASMCFVVSCFFYLQKRTCKNFYGHSGFRASDRTAFKEKGQNQTDSENPDHFYLQYVQFDIRLEIFDISRSLLKAVIPCCDSWPLLLFDLRREV